MPENVTRKSKMPENIKWLLRSQETKGRLILFLEITRLQMEINSLLFSCALSFAEDLHLQVW